MASKGEEVDRAQGLLERLRKSSYELIETTRVKDEQREAAVVRLEKENAMLRTKIEERERDYEMESATMRRSLEEYQSVLA